MDKMQKGAAPEVPIFDPDQMRRALRESEFRLLSVVNSAPMVLWALDTEGSFTFSEGKGLEAVGLRGGEIVGKSIYEVYQNFPDVLDDYHRALEGEEFTSVRNVSGLTFEARYSPVLEEDGRVGGVIGVAVDITERRRAESDRERAVSLLKATLESTADGILVVDSQGGIATYNTKFTEMWGIPREILDSGQDQQAIAHVLSQLRDPEAFLGKVRDLYSNPDASSFDVLDFEDGRIFERYSQPQRVGDDIVGRVWSFRDVTERRRSEEALRRRERQLEHTQRLTHLGSWEWEVATNVVTWSDELYRIYGLEPGSIEISFEEYLSRVHSDDRQGVAAEIQTALAEGGVFGFVERVVRPDGSERVLRSQGEVVRDETGRPLRLVGACHDITDEIDAEQALRNAEASYRAIFELSNDAIFVLDTETGEVVDANALAAELQPLADGSGEGEPSAAAASTRAPVDREYLALAAAGEAQLYERRFETPAGEVRWFEVSLRRVAINGVDRLLATARDVTERKEAEAVLMRSHDQLEGLVEDRTAELAQTNMALEEEIADRERAEEELIQRTAELESIFHALPDLYFRLDGDGRILAHRSGRDSSLELAPDAYIGERIQDLLPEEARSAFETALAEVLRTGRLARVEYSVGFEQGPRHFEARVLPHVDGQLITIARDISDRHRAEQALRRSEEHYRRLIDNSSDVATILGPDGVNRYQSPSIERVLGYRPEEMAGTSAFERIHPDDAPACREVLRWVMQNPGSTRSVEFRYRHKDGSWRVLEAGARTLLPDSAEEGIVVNSRDITERRQYEDALEEAKEEAERANRAKSEFLSRMSHELRTPLNSILGFSQLLTRRQLPPEQRKPVDHILKAGRHLLNLINEVLEISRIEAGRQNFSLEPVRLEAVLSETRSLIHPLAVQHAIDLEDCEIDPELYVMADRQRLSQVMLNLLSNAVKYNRQAGRVAVSCHQVISPEGQARIQIGVRDTGPGIPADKVDRLFMPFERLGAEQSQVEGTGLGLALSKRLVEAMGGSMWLESTVGQGSTFWVQLDRVASPAERAAASRIPLSPQSGRRGEVRPAKLLYVEDNLPNLTLIETILSDRPEIELLTALQGAMGIYLAMEHRPDVILLDLHLPDMAGDEVLVRLKADDRTREIPVIVVSADATAASLERLAGAGAEAYLTKPIDVVEFLDTVDRFLDARRSAK